MASQTGRANVSRSGSRTSIARAGSGRAGLSAGTSNNTSRTGTSASTPTTDIEQGTPPPAYDDVISSTRYPVARQNSEGSQQGWRLSFVDFTPHLEGHGRQDGQSFSTLVKKANTWLKSNATVEIKNCETVTWIGTSQSEINDTDIVRRTKSMNPLVPTKMLRGLRLWLVPRAAGSATVLLGLQEFVPRDKDESLWVLIKRVNKKLKETPIPGHILNIETVSVPTKNGKPQGGVTQWSEYCTQKRLFAFAIRIFFLTSPQATEEEIGVRDFMPNQQSGSYERLSGMMERARRWVSAQRNIRITNVQTVWVKQKGSTKSEAMFYTEHSSKSRSSKATCYYQVLRVAYVRRPGDRIFSLGLPPLLTKKTFAPAILVNSQTEGARFEGFTKTVERVSAWLQSTGAEVFSVETCPVRMHTGGQEQNGPEATLAFHKAVSGLQLEHWLIYIRIYLKGPYREPNMHRTLSAPPFEWYRRRTPSTRSRRQRRHNTKRRNLIIFLILFLILAGAIAIFLYFYVVR